MTLADLEQKLGLKALTPYQDLSVEGAYTSDLLSDAIAHCVAEGVFITLQAHKNTVAVAALAGVRAIVLAHHLSAPEDMLAAAEAEGIAVFGSKKNQFQLSLEIGKCLESQTL